MQINLKTLRATLFLQPPRSSKPPSPTPSPTVCPSCCSLSLSSYRLSCIRYIDIGVFSVVILVHSFGFVYFINQPYDSHVLSSPDETSLSPTVCPSVSLALSSSYHQDLQVQLQSVADSLKDCIWKQLGTLPTTASILSHLTVPRITYAVASKHNGNSYILLDSASFPPAEHICSNCFTG